MGIDFRLHDKSLIESIAMSPILIILDRNRFIFFFITYELNVNRTKNTHQ